MQYRVIGSNKETGAKTSMEFEAESKAAAERKAMNAGMNVTRVEDISDGTAKHAVVHGGSGRSAGMSPLVKLVILILVLGAIWYFFGGRIRSMIGM